jgi:hypothetical protein
MLYKIIKSGQVGFKRCGGGHGDNILKEGRCLLKDYKSLQEAFQLSIWINNVQNTMKLPNPMIKQSM